MDQKASPLAGEIFRALFDSRDTAAVALFLSLLRQMPGLRQWLCFVSRIPDARRRLDAAVSGKVRPPPSHREGRALLAWIAGPPGVGHHYDPAVANTEKHRHRHGGLTRSQVIGQIRSYQAGTIGLAPFLITCAWRHCPPDAEPSAALLQATALFLKEAVTRGSPDLMRHAAKAVSFFHKSPIGKITRERFGFPNWWKLVLFQYILTNPKPCYRVREFQRHLRGQGLQVEDKHLRRFCQKHGIARDMRPGRPKRAAPD
ncbi:hypothetical protein OH491_10440 [Termitidicoccus mucosus]